LRASTWPGYPARSSPNPDEERAVGNAGFETFEISRDPE